MLNRPPARAGTKGRLTISARLNAGRNSTPTPDSSQAVQPACANRPSSHQTPVEPAASGFLIGPRHRAYAADASELFFAGAA
jgi:hypothetical protein